MRHRRQNSQASIKQHEIYQPSALQVSLFTSHYPLSPHFIKTSNFKQSPGVKPRDFDTKPFNRSALALQLPYTSCTPVTQPTEISDPISSQGCSCSGEHSRNAVSLTSYKVKDSSCCRWNRQTVRSYRKKLIVGMQHQEQYCCRQPQAGETVLMLQNDTSHPMCMCACMGKRDSA